MAKHHYVYIYLFSYTCSEQYNHVVKSGRSGSGYKSKPAVLKCVWKYVWCACSFLIWCTCFLAEFNLLKVEECWICSNDSRNHASMVSMVSYTKELNMDTIVDTVDGRHPKQPPWNVKNLVDNGRNYQHQLGDCRISELPTVGNSSSKPSIASMVPVKHPKKTDLETPHESIPMSWTDFSLPNHPHSIHVWYVYLHVP